MRLTLAAGGIAILVIATSGRTLPLLALWLDVGGPPQKADAVVLLNSSPNSRPFVAAALVHGGWAPKIILNTVADHPSEVSGEVPRYFDIYLKVLAYGGVPADRVVRLDSGAATTFDEAQAVARYLAEHPAKKLLIVTESPHTRRRDGFSRVLADRPVEIAMISAPADEFQNKLVAERGRIPVRRQRILQVLLLRPEVRASGLRNCRRRGGADSILRMVFAAAETNTKWSRLLIVALKMSHATP